MSESASFQTIVVPLDGSGYGERAMPWALALAVPSTRLILLQVTPTAHAVTDFRGKTVGSSDDIQQAYAETARRNLETIEEKWCPDREDVSLVTAQGDPADEILRIAREEDADIIIMSSHGQGAVGRFVSGSVADQIVRTAPLPVMIIGPDGDLSPKQTIRRVILPMDGSEQSHRALPIAEAIANQAGAEVYVVSVVSPVTRLADDQVDAIDSSLVSLSFKQATDFVSEVVGALRHRGVSADGDVLTGRVAPAITGTVEPGDVLVVTSQSRTFLHRWAMGSNAMKLISSGQAPVVVLNRECLDSLADDQTDAGSYSATIIP